MANCGCSFGLAAITFYSEQATRKNQTGRREYPTKSPRPYFGGIAIFYHRQSESY